MSVSYLNGEFIESTKAHIAATDQGFLLGHGIFETLRIAKGEPLSFSYHFERFSDSAKRLGFEAPDRHELYSAVLSLIAQNDFEEARLRVTLTDLTLLITMASLPDYPATAKVVTVPFARNEMGALAGVKSVSYGENLLAMRYAKEKGADEAIFTNTKGELCEGATTNIFLMTDGRWVTPSLASGCLPGTTRRKVLGLADISIEESTVLLSLPEVQFAFLTSSLRGLQPIDEFDGVELPRTHAEFDQLQRQFFAI